MRRRFSRTSWVNDALTVRNNRCVLEVLANREKATVVAYLTRAKHAGLLAQVEEVTADIWDANVAAAQEVCGDEVIITMDRFHVMKNFQECLTGTRRELQRKRSERERMQLEGSRWLWVTNPSAEERQQLEALQQHRPELGTLAEQRESLPALFNDATIRQPTEGRARLQAWLEQAQRLGLVALNQLCKLLNNWLDKIAHYFRNRSSNGRTERLNHGLRAILWRAYGMSNCENVRLRVLHCFGFRSK
jgi:transposase